MSRSSEKARILVVDDAEDMLDVLRRNLDAAGHRVFAATDVATAIRILDSTPVDLVITDLKMPRVGGMELIRHVRENLKDVEIVVITGFPSIDTAVEAVKTGAEDYLTKPFTGEELEAAVGRAMAKLRNRRARQRAAEPMEAPFQGMVGGTPAMQGVFDAVTKAAATRVHVLVAGESGTGKELVARAIHYTSPRASQPFVPVNCGGIPEGLLESELFGHVKGSFTGATDTRPGFFQTADRGTLFLDEISETSLGMQVKLLRVLEDRMVYMIGSRRSQKVDVRVVAATNKNLPQLIAQGRFRDDLYYRLNVITIEIPPLRERRDDVLPLVHHFARRLSAGLHVDPPEFSDAALQALREYPWPGNVRELENAVHRLVVMAEGHVVDVPDLPSVMRFSASRVSGLDRSLDEVEAEHILNVLASVQGNKTRAADILGIDRKTLREKLKRLRP